MSGPDQRLQPGAAEVGDPARQKPIEPLTGFRLEDLELDARPAGGAHGHGSDQQAMELEMSAPDSAAAASSDGGASTARHARILKIVVSALGAMIVLGLVAVVSRIIYLANRPAPQAASAATVTAKSLPARLVLPAGASVRHIAMSGDRLAVHYEAAAGAAIAVVDLTTGQVLSRIELAAEPPRN